MQKSVRRGDMGEVVVDGVTFVFDETGTKLVKKGSADAPQISTAQTSTTPLQTSVHGEDYVRTKRGNLINKKLVVERRATRAKALQAEHSATPAHTVGDVQSKLRPLHTPRALCNYYTRTGACRRGIACPFQHDPSKRAICPGVLKPTGCVHPRGACLLSHTPSAHSMPHCVHYLRTGTCRNGESCEYTHTRMAPDAPLCRPFSQLGWCDEGAACVQRHARECPDFSAQGACKSKGCRLAHVDRAAPDVPLEPGPDTLFVRDDSGAAEETRYFDEAPEPEQLHAETMHGSTKAFAQQRDFISLDDAPVSDTSDTESVLSYATAESDEEVERILSI
ncbi:hypothetical protein MVES1_000881 [Malassezia vespertilionis]|uniref:uncharacterized protein n=1 Tax=Malassezia vespertilionis TaxID=2020962 RepID=UPI0024B20D2E|nr:uncharacterized protein MVES1_000881 [Malassezia vespertilionis]WFD05551.1 hypothetical protein MVES1_000881 [Malassezia vespertilionis]